jgi:hypothetical protein
MLLRQESNRIVAISQPAHARLSGDLAAEWGNAHFLAPSAGECLAASVHDIGWLEWELHPEFDAEKGRPRIFADVPVTTHTKLWEDGVERASIIDTLTGVLVSQHAETIYERTFDFDKAEPGNAALVRKFLDRQRDYRTRAIGAARRAGRSEPFVDERLIFAKRLIAAVDAISLLLCWGAREASIEQAPTSLRETATLRFCAEKGHQFFIQPWPFRSDALTVAVEGRPLPQRLESAEAMNRALEKGEYAQMEFLIRRNKD